MTLEEFRSKVSAPLPGVKGQRLMMPSYRNAVAKESVMALNPRKAGVIMHVFEGDEGLELLYMKRSSYNGTHSAQISFPGGELEDFDEDLKAAAFRECEEEVGLKPMAQEFLRPMTWLYIPPSNFYVEPFLSCAQGPPNIEIDTVEVDRVFSIPLVQLLDDSLVQQTKIETTYGTMNVPAYHWDREIIWGATAMMTSELVALVR
jgi:8-oxo-dGTP pyrophosphatase MutT (NUDIX family)